MIKETQEQKELTDYRAGILLSKCDACGRDIELYEKVFDYGGKICKDCFLDVPKGFKALDRI